MNKKYAYGIVVFALLVFALHAEPVRAAVNQFIGEDAVGKNGLGAASWDEPSVDPELTQGAALSGQVGQGTSPLGGFSCSIVTDLTEIEECEALVVLYIQTNGYSWTNDTNWLSSTSVDTWYGVTVVGGHVERLSLINNALDGSLPPELGNLSNLQELYFYNNQLTGSIPPELGSLSSLQELYLDNNQLTGSIPPELGSLSSLQVLYLDNNQLTGSIPPELGSLSSLQELYLANNQLTGSIPPELGSLILLKYLRMGDNQLSGEIPPELGSLTALDSLNLNDNQLSGEIPPELGSLTNLEGLYLQNNRLSGSIPAEIGNLSRLNILYLNDNQLEGRLPAEMGDLGNLDILFLNNNQLSGSIPLTFTALNELQVFTFLQTNLCEPDDADFQAWKATVHDWYGNGEICQPPAAAADAYTTDEDCPLTAADVDGVLANDSDPNGDVLSALLQGGPSHGAVTLAGGGGFTYTPAANFVGADSFTYKAFDGELYSAETTVAITVNPVNDAPTADDKALETPQETALLVSLSGADVEGDPLVFSVVGMPAHGSLGGSAPNLTYTPAADFVGVDSFTYKAYDGALYSAAATVSITVQQVHFPIFLPMITR